MTAATVPAVYGTALYEVAQERGNATAVIDDCAALATALRAEPGLILRIDSPALSRAQAKAELRQMLDGKTSNVLVDFLCLLVDRNRFAQSPQILDEAVAVANRAAGVVPVLVTVAEPLPSELRAQLTATFEKTYGEGVVLTVEVDPALLGGLRVQVADTLIDASVARQLDDLREHLLNIPVSTNLVVA